jgi:hypothetical protein
MSTVIDLIIRYTDKVYQSRRQSVLSLYGLQDDPSEEASPTDKDIIKVEASPIPDSCR